MKLTQDGEVLAENKVLILYILNKMENPITNDGLLRLVLAVMDMNYFYFQQFLLDLIERNYIVCFFIFFIESKKCSSKPPGVS